jgi:twitching motility two-component system response regulator PilG
VAFLPRTSIRDETSPSDATVGSRDTLTIDSNTFSQTTPPQAAEPRPVVSPSGHPKTKKILVVEDSSTTRMVITKILTQKGYTIVEACDGLEALNKAHNESPDLILLDIILPKMTGYDILSVIKRHPVLKNTPVIMLTSRDGFLDKVKGKLAGSTEYLTKPFDSAKLLEAIERYA